MTSREPPSILPSERIERRIFLIRGEKVMLDFDLADIYDVPTKALNQAVRRNLKRFPEDFMFQLSNQELATLRSQIVTSNSWTKMGLRRRPYAFTEQGVAMLSSVLRSERAIQVNLDIMRVFVRLRRLIATNADVARRVDKLEENYHRLSKSVVAVIDHLSRPPEPRKKHPLGFRK